MNEQPIHQFEAQDESPIVRQEQEHYDTPQSDRAHVPFSNTVNSPSFQENGEKHSDQLNGENNAINEIMSNTNFNNQQKPQIIKPEQYDDYSLDESEESERQ